MTTQTTATTQLKPIEQVLIVYKKSQYELYQHSPDAAVRAYLTNEPAQAAKLKESHEQNYATLDAVTKAFTKDSKPFHVTTRYRGDVTQEMLTSTDLVVSVGGDGTALDIGHLCGATPILGVNSDPKNSVGFFCTANANTIDDVVATLYTQPVTTLTTMQPYIDGVPTRERAINDLLFAHHNVAGMTKYEITKPTQETRKDSGLLVCTAAGSTAWMYQIGGDLMPLSDTRMQYRSRDLRGATSKFADDVEIISRIRDAKITIDTQHIQYDIGLGQGVKLQHGQPLHIIGNLQKKKN